MVCVCWEGAGVDSVREQDAMRLEAMLREMAAIGAAPVPTVQQLAQRTKRDRMQALLGALLFFLIS